MTFIPAAALCAALAIGSALPMTAVDVAPAALDPAHSRVVRSIALRLRVDGLGRLQDVIVALSSGDRGSDGAARAFASRAVYPATSRDWTAAAHEYLQIIHVAPWSGELDAGPLLDWADHGVVLVRDGFLAIPDQARRSHATGNVTVRVVVEASGRLSSADVVTSSGNADLDAAALSSARSALYLPATANGEAVRAPFTATYQFDVHVIQAV